MDVIFDFVISSIILILISACFKGHGEIVELLLPVSNVNAPEMTSRSTPLHLAAQVQTQNLLNSTVGQKFYNLNRNFNININFLGRLFEYCQKTSAICKHYC